MGMTWGDISYAHGDDDEPPLTLVVCSECDGAGEWDEGPINCGGPAPVDPEYRQVICPVCGGKGQTVEPVQSDDEAECNCRYGVHGSYCDGSSSSRPRSFLTSIFSDPLLKGAGVLPDTHKGR